MGGMHGAAPGLPEGSDVQPHVVGWERADVSIWEEKRAVYEFWTPGLYPLKQSRQCLQQGTQPLLLHCHQNFPSPKVDASREANVAL